MSLSQETIKELNVVCLGDVHAGSHASVAVPDMPLCGGGTLDPSPMQKALHQSWCDLAKEWQKPDILIANGDLIEGQARKESGVPCWSTDLDDQIECAFQLLKMFEAKCVYITEGTGYHVDAGGKSLEHHIGKRIKAKQIGVNKQHAAPELFLRAGGHTFHAAHHISVGTGWYKTTPLARELVFALLNESDFHKTDIVLRSHVHYFCGVEFHRQRGYTLPCWQLRTRYMMKKSAFGMTPSIGALRFRLYPGEIRMDKRFFKCVEARPKLWQFEPTETPAGKP